jgi:hypothetical protein
MLCITNLFKIAQIALYMFKSRTKYGFLTTYDDTVFLCQEPSPNDPNTFILLCSSIIKYSTQSVMIANNDFSDNALYLNRVSLRECFLFLVSAIHSGPYIVANPMTWHEWTGQKIHNTRALQRDAKLQSMLHNSRH